MFVVMREHHIVWHSNGLELIRFIQDDSVALYDQRIAHGAIHFIAPQLYQVGKVRVA